MATQHDTPSTVDLEETAELPILPGASTIIGADDPMGATDSWMVSPGAAGIRPGTKLGRRAGCRCPQ